ncbi:hypothetical protein LRP67_03625 [Nocardioides sp. cx-169]|uniref:hypothetical protein n=1 Tax=Nocardioides sp. cx-169 TaxID=2899080 RepID=UPI001E29AA9D|nr:hypothetical protein [Nocardioides sp. cx-169]MCD4533168.1 hypothetical protein [Nocardioides sp. cx-169]
METSRRVSPALLVATAALAVALLGSPLAELAHAAGQIGTAQLAKNAVTSPKVKNNSLSGVDLRNRSVTGADLRDGSVRAADLAPDARSMAYYKETFGNVPVGTTATTILVLALPAGSYLVHATTPLTNVSGSGRDAYCRLTHEATAGAEVRALDSTAERMGTADVTGVFRLTTAGTVSFVCRASAAGVYTPSSSMPRITALSVGSVASQTPALRTPGGQRTGR